jgi:hypothetical protein
LVFNEKEGNWEVSIRLFQDDLEQGLSQFKGKRFQFQQAQGAEELIQEFVKKQFGFMVNQVMQTPSEGMWRVLSATRIDTVG